MRKRSSKGGGAQRSIQVHLMVNEEEAAMIRDTGEETEPDGIPHHHRSGKAVGGKPVRRGGGT